MGTGNYTIRTMSRSELDMAIEWAAAEGWNPGANDASCFHAADPNGFLVGCLDEVPVATLSAVRYGASFGFVGLYIVKPGYRGKGYGRSIWDAGLAYLEGRTVGLDGVVAQQAAYRSCGFNLAHRNIRYQGTGLGPGPLAGDVVALSTLPFPAISTYDKPFFADDRTAFLKCWLTQPESAGFGVMRDGRLAGYGVVRSSQSGHKIGPLCADDVVIAERLLTTLREQVPTGTPIFLDVPELNPEAVAMAGRERMKPVFETARMYKGEPPTLPVKRIFGITTFELG